jgi:hypothetical protein
MIGQHPRMYGLPETHLLRDETLAGWWGRVDCAQYPMADGLVRAVAQLWFGEQTEVSVRKATGWLRRRASFATAHVMEILGEEVQPAMLVEKSPSMIYYPDVLERIADLFPQARFLHLVRHPRGHGESVLRYLQDVARHGSVPGWLSGLASFPNPFARADDAPVDPQRSWYILNRNACIFFASLPDSRKLVFRGEDVLCEPEESLMDLFRWLGLQTGADDIEAMKHPERGPFARYGPPGARLGNDYFFLSDPTLRRARAEPFSLDGPLPWRSDGRGFSPEVQELARQFGYQ